MVAVFHISESEFYYFMNCFIVFYLFLSDIEIHRFISLGL